MKKRFTLITIVILVISILSINIFMKTKTIEKSYNGFYINADTKEIIGKCSVEINIKYNKWSIDEFKKIIKYYTGTISIDDESYNFKGNTALNDELEYYNNDEGNNRIAFCSEEKDGVIYKFDLYEKFKDEYFIIRMEDEKELHNSNIEVISTINDNIDEVLNTLEIMDGIAQSMNVL